MLNKPKTAAYRAPGSPAAAYALETWWTRSARSWVWTLWSSVCSTAPKRARAGSPAPCIPRSDSWKWSRRPRTTTTTRPHWRGPTGAGASPAASGSTARARPAPQPASTPTARSAWSKVRRTSEAPGSWRRCTWPRCWVWPPRISSPRWATPTRWALPPPQEAVAWPSRPGGPATRPPMTLGAR